LWAFAVAVSPHPPLMATAERRTSEPSDLVSSGANAKKGAGAVAKRRRKQGIAPNAWMEDLTKANTSSDGTVVGTPEQCRARLTALLESGPGPRLSPEQIKLIMKHYAAVSAAAAASDRTFGCLRVRLQHTSRTTHFKYPPSLRTARAAADGGLNVSEMRRLSSLDRSG
jgi:hypothetical protein